VREQREQEVYRTYDEATTEFYTFPLLLCRAAASFDSFAIVRLPPAADFQL
jgi:hypothetical protein